MTAEKSRIARIIDSETPDHTAFVLICLGWASPSLLKLLEQGVPVYCVGATDEIEGLIMDSGLAFYREKRSPIIAAFEHAKDGYLFEARLAALEGCIQ
jgi:hypothetical protein